MDAAFSSALRVTLHGVNDAAARDGAASSVDIARIGLNAFAHSASPVGDLY
jgi:hypothetical protein